MKILLTTDAFYPMINGVVISTHNLYKELKLMGHDVKILTLSEDGRERIDGDIYYLKSFNLRIYPGAKVKKLFSKEIVDKLLAWKPDIIHSQTEFSTMVDAKLIAWKLKIPHLHTYHTMYEDYLYYILNGKVISPKTMGLCLKLLLNSLNEIVAPTEKVKEALISYGVKTNINIIPTGIDLSKFQRDITEEEKNSLKLQYGLNSKDKILLYLGRIAQEKNIDSIINMFDNIQDEMKDLKLLIVGSGPYLDNLKNLVETKGLNNKIFFTGMVEPENVYKYYKIADAFVTSSTSETQGLTYIEALSTGLPVICKYDPCIEGVIENGKNGLVFDNEIEFSNSIKSIFSDENYRKMLSKHAESTADKYSSSNFAKTVFQLYETTIENYNTLLNQNYA
ncbi:glycosyltransferase family 4 protein [Clostridium sp. JNZ J1-5]